MAVRFHERMHTTIWAWIRAYCDTAEHDGPHDPKTPADVLECICSKIPYQNDTRWWVSQELPDHYVISGGEIEDMMGSFSENVCTVGEYLHTSGKQQKLHWLDLKNVLQHYIYDINSYMTKVNSLGYNYTQLNQYFDLNLSESMLRVIGPAQMAEHLLWARYLTGVCVFIPNLDQMGDDPPFMEYLFARGDDVYWGPKISNEVFDEGEPPDLYASYPVGHRLNPGGDGVDNNNDEALEKKKEGLKKIQEIVDEVKEDIGDGVYLKVMDVMKEAWS